MDSTIPSPQQPESQPVQPPDEAPKETNQVSYELTVSEDKLEAYLSAQVEGDVSITIEDLKQFLKEKHISNGLVNDSEIEKYISQGVILREPCLMAKGVLPQPGKDAQVNFFFDRGPLKMGKIKDGGGIDFKEKGDIPQVKLGDVLSEKIPLIKEKAGVDVYGRPIPVERVNDAVMSSGTGTIRSTDGLKIHAQIAGRPEVLGDGRLCIFSEIRINGDVNLATGHIRFEGFVDVGGTIQEGFRVKAGKLVSKEIFRAEVDLEELKQENNPTRLAQTRWKLQDIEHKLTSTEDTLKKLQDQQDQVMQTTSALQSIIQELDSAIQGLRSEIRSKLEGGQLKEKPMVKVTKAIYDGTTVEGLHSTLVLKESLPDTLIREEKVKVVSPEGEETFEWQMKWTSHP